jgi:hypothetical protein
VAGVSDLVLKGVAGGGGRGARRRRTCPTCHTFLPSEREREEGGAARRARAGVARGGSGRPGRTEARRTRFRGLSEVSLAGRQVCHADLARLTLPPPLTSRVYLRSPPAGSCFPGVAMVLHHCHGPRSVLSWRVRRGLGGGPEPSGATRGPVADSAAPLEEGHPRGPA